MASPPDDGRRQRASAIQADMAKLRTALGSIADIRSPMDAEEPILAPAVRVALRQWMVEIRAAEELKSVGVKPRSTAILYGPPGTGKTTLAHHLSARLGIPMVVVGPETLVGKYLGDSSSNVVKLFDGITKADVRCLLFMDEIDAIGASRDSHGESSASTELRSMLTTMLRKVEEYRGFLVSATNRQDSIDKALWRRFHIQLSVDLPGGDERWAILKRYSLPFLLPDDAIDILADLTEGASPALLRGVMEGMKRALVIHPKLGISIDRPETVFGPIITSLAPPPGIDKPPLWQNPATMAALASMGWPPPRAQDSEDGQ